MYDHEKTSKFEEGVCTEYEFKYNCTKATEEILDKLYNNEAMCAEGIDVEEIIPECLRIDSLCKKYLDWIIISWGLKKIESVDFYHCLGKDLNDKYHLTGDNQYPEDLFIFFIDWQSFVGEDERPVKGNFRWFSDVVDNNARREIRKCNTFYNGYHSLYGDEWFYSTI